MTKDEIEALMNRAMKQSERWREMKNEVKREEDIIDSVLINKQK